MRIMKYVVKTFIMILCAYSIFSCSGGSGGAGGGGGAPSGNGSGGNAPSGGGNGANAGSTRLFFTGSLESVDPTATIPSATIVESGTTSGTSLYQSGNFDSLHGQITGLKPRAVIFGRQADGKLYQVSASLGDPLNPVQTSSESGAASICEKISGTDYRTFNNSVYFYSICNIMTPTQWRLIRLGMSPTDPPIPLPANTVPLVKGILYGGDGAISGFLAIDTGNHRFLQCDFTVACNKVISNYQGEVTIIGHNPFTGRMNVVIDNDIYAYDANSGTISGSKYSFMAAASSTSSTVNDASFTYFYDCAVTFGTTCGGSAVYAVALDGQQLAAAMLLAIDASAMNYGPLFLTSSSVIYNVFYDTVSNGVTTTANSIRAVQKYGLGKPIDLVTPSDNPFDMAGTSNNWVHYTRRDSGHSPKAGEVAEDGSNNVELFQSMWAGNTSSTVLSLDHPAASRFLRLKGCITFANSIEIDCSGGKLEAVDESGQNVLATLGNLPGGMVDATFEGIGDYALGYSSTSVANTSNSYLFANAAVGNSLSTVAYTLKYMRPLF
jgi:hypothetical protein